MDCAENLSPSQRMRLVIIDQISEHYVSCKACSDLEARNCDEFLRLGQLLTTWSYKDIEEQVRKLVDRSAS